MACYILMTAARSVVLSSRCASRLWYPVNETSVAVIGDQSVRWRKARWIPTAKSKMFRIPERKTLPDDEYVEMMRLYNIYRTRMKAVRQHLIDEKKRTAATSELALQQAAAEEEEHQRLMEYNHQENLRVAAVREERVQKEFEADIARVKASKERYAEKALLAEEEALRIIRETEELVKTFIKREDLEVAIEKAMANPVDYNFALDMDGKIYPGLTTKLEGPDKDQDQMTAVAMN